MGWGFSGDTTGKEFTCQFRRYKRLWFDPWARKIPWRRKWQNHSSILAWETHGQKSPAGYSPWGPKRVEHDLAIEQLNSFQNMPLQHKNDLELKATN